MEYKTFVTVAIDFLYRVLCLIARGKPWQGIFQNDETKRRRAGGSLCHAVKPKPRKR